VSMGMGSALKLKQVLSNAEYIFAIELLCAAQGVDFHRPLRAGIGSRRALHLVRRHVPELNQDRVLAPDIERVRLLIERGEVSRIISRVNQ
jgi:histidine ammonia-lyase